MSAELKRGIVTRQVGDCWIAGVRFHEGGQCHYGYEDVYRTEFLARLDMLKKLDGVIAEETKHESRVEQGKVIARGDTPIRVWTRRDDRHWKAGLLKKGGEIIFECSCYSQETALEKVSKMLCELFGELHVWLGWARETGT